MQARQDAKDGNALVVHLQRYALNPVVPVAFSALVSPAPDWAPREVGMARPSLVSVQESATSPLGSKEVSVSATQEGAPKPIRQLPVVPATGRVITEQEME